MDSGSSHCWSRFRGSNDEATSGTSISLSIEAISSSVIGHQWPLYQAGARKPRTSIGELSAFRCYLAAGEMNSGATQPAMPYAIGQAAPTRPAQSVSALSIFPSWSRR